MSKFTKEEIQKKLIENNIVVIKGKYNNWHSEFVVQDKNGYKAIIKVGALMKGTNPSYFRKINPYTIDNIKLWCKLNNYPYTYVKGEYKCNSSKLTFKCKKHGEFEIAWNKIISNRGCPKCANNIKHTFEEVSKKAIEFNPYVEILENTYNGAFSKVKCRCLHHNKEYETVWKKLYNGVNSCSECRRERFKGENNPRYNPNITDEQRQANESERHTLEYKQWVKSVLKKDGYTCQCCGSSKSGTLIAHHLNGFDNFIEERIDVNNGITLCEDCHKLFHKTYGYGRNTKEQYFEWINN